jgi:hypothetical protein
VARKAAPPQTDPPTKHLQASTPRRHPSSGRTDRSDKSSRIENILKRIDLQLALNRQHLGRRIKF